MISYFLNWMGPLTNQWYEERGLLKVDGEIYVERLGVTIPNYTITQEYATGRVDVSGLDPDEYYDGKTEYSAPMMKKESWYGFSYFLKELKTNELYSFDELVKEYEKNNSKIEWFDL